jgi:hypothetical protein
MGRTELGFNDFANHFQDVLAVPYAKVCALRGRLGPMHGQRRLVAASISFARGRVYFLYPLNCARARSCWPGRPPLQAAPRARPSDRPSRVAALGVLDHLAHLLVRVSVCGVRPQRTALGLPRKRRRRRTCPPPATSRAGTSTRTRSARCSLRSGWSAHAPGARCDAPPRARKRVPCGARAAMMGCWPARFAGPCGGLGRPPTAALTATLSARRLPGRNSAGPGVRVGAVASAGWSSAGPNPDKSAADLSTWPDGSASGADLAVGRRPP